MRASGEPEGVGTNSTNPTTQYSAGYGARPNLQNSETDERDYRRSPGGGCALGNQTHDPLLSNEQIGDSSQNAGIRRIVEHFVRRTALPVFSRAQRSVLRNVSCHNSCIVHSPTIRMSEMQLATGAIYSRRKPTTFNEQPARVYWKKVRGVESMHSDIASIGDEAHHDT